MNHLECPDVLLDSLENGQLVIDENFTVFYWNKWLSVNTQIDKKDILNKNLQEFYPDVNYKVLLRKIKTAIKLNAPTFYDSNNRSIFLPIKRNKITTKSLDMMQQQITISPYVKSENKVMISIYDISELYEIKLSLKNEIDKVKELNEILETDKNIIDKNIMIIRISLEGVIIEASTLFCDFFEYQKEALIGQKISILKSGNIPESTYQNLWETISEGKPWYGEIQNKCANGKLKWVEMKILPIFDKDGKVVEFNAFYHDIINKKLLEELYITDPLTKIYNRVHFDDMFADITKYQRKAEIDFALIISDIDHFKSINDTYGHQVGDEALKEVANVLKNSFRDSDIVARWGGEEFVIILKNVTIQEAQIITEKVRKNIENTKIQNSINITSSFGLTKYCAGEDQKETFKRVDDALYEAKNSGRNRVVVK